MVIVSVEAHLGGLNCTLQAPMPFLHAANDKGGHVLASARDIGLTLGRAVMGASPKFCALRRVKGGTKSEHRLKNGCAITRFAGGRHE